jgi:hypothetical protein
MDEHRVTGTAKNVGGKIEEVYGRVAGDMKSLAFRAVPAVLRQ